MKSKIFYFAISFAINLIFWVEIFYGYYYNSSPTWAWIDFAWMVITPIFGIWCLVYEKSRWMYLAGLVASLVIVLAIKYIFQLAI